MSSLKSAMTYGVVNLPNFPNVPSRVDIMNFLNQGTLLSKVIKAIIIIIILTILIKTAIFLYKKYKDLIDASPYIFKGTKSSKISKVITQDPKKHNSITAKRSDDSEFGLEFTYVFWMIIDDWTYKYGDWKHVFHKGSKDGYPLRSPGVWIHPKENKLRIYMNTLDKISEYIDINNIPINKWFCVSINMKQKKLDVFINGSLKKSKTLKSLPKQNYGDIYLNNNGGFSGNFSNLRYFNRYISYSELRDHLNKGPDSIPINYDITMPPYFKTNWWTTN